MAKYSNEAVWPIRINGCSTGWLPIQVRVMVVAENVQNRNCEVGRNIMACCLDVCSKGMAARIRIDRSSARTPPSLFGIDRRIA